ncbi:hypothetical protein [Streptomyces hesseae]|uniref:Uncharacterized protein n=1 Tax=Streptomyces hesseae TaxID=3075519 RepID=A0ABU2SWC3_9ACTN|nr:hypothetical protein [Streptomyces sp. DSM 40473]MDT0452175.1 hypothetical protein [Streptomyces sp. DSM 40473]
MSDLEFYAHVATRGDVLGAGIGSPPAAWEEELGPDYADNTSAGLIGRDYGLVQLSFQEDEGIWACTDIKVRVRSLIRGAGVVPPPLREAYGEFTHRVGFDDLRALITDLGHSVEPDDDASVTDDFHRYRVSGSGARIFVVADADPYGNGDIDPDDPTEKRVGDVLYIDVSPAWWSDRD